MIFINSKLENINQYFEKNFDLKYGTKTIDNNFFDLEQDTTNYDILILDIDQFKTIDEVINFFDTLPKILNVIALVEQPKLNQGAYFIKKGFKSYLGKKTSKIIIEQAIKTVIEGNIWIYPQLMNFIIKNIDVPKNETNKVEVLDTLTQKEQKIASLVSKGYSNKQIAQNLGVQLVTVKKHIGNIFTKLDVKDRVALAILINSK